MEPVLKVLAYITRAAPEGLQLLVFEHQGSPEAGVQVPGGTVDPGEELLDALRREVVEESGLTDLAVVCPLAADPFEWEGRTQLRHVFHVEAPPETPDSWSHTVTAGEEDCGLVFLYRWIRLDEAGALLINGQGSWADALREQVAGSCSS